MMGPGGGAGAILRVSFGVPPLESPSQTKKQGSLKVESWILYEVVYYMKQNLFLVLVPVNRVF